MNHIPVLLEEVLEALRPAPGMHLVDGTVGLGGHATALLERTGPDGRLLGLDRDDRNLSRASEMLQRFGARVTLAHGSFAQLREQAERAGLAPIVGVLFDLGFSSVHVDDASRGFSFQQDGPLDMRYDTRQEVTASTLVNEAGEAELADLFRRLGEEPHAERIAQKIVEARSSAPITRTLELADLVCEVSPRRGRLHPATRVFQALRMAVNDELGHLARGIEAACDVLASGGRLAIISFHSLEDRLIKQAFRARHHQGFTVLTKHVIKPSFGERKRNPRSRSAKLRILEKY